MRALGRPCMPLWRKYLQPARNAIFMKQLKIVRSVRELRRCALLFYIGLVRLRVIAPFKYKSTVNVYFLVTVFWGVTKDLNSYLYYRIWHLHTLELVH